MGLLCPALLLGGVRRRTKVVVVRSPEVGNENADVVVVGDVDSSALADALGKVGAITAFFFFGAKICSLQSHLGLRLSC